MKINQTIAKIFWYWIAERQSIFYAKNNGLREPWTSDKILQDYKFCNAYRASDRFSQFLIKDVIYNSKFSQAEEDIIFRILLARLFNKEETFNFLAERMSLKVGEFKLEEAIFRLTELKEKQALFSPAFFINPTKAFGYQEKYKNYLALALNMIETDLVSKITNAIGLGEVFSIIKRYPLMGEFFSYQIAIDFNYSEVINFDENSFVQPGPGAKRGLNKLFDSTEGFLEEELILHLVENQEKYLSEQGYIPEKVWLFGRPLKAIDIQASLCEVDKYCREAAPKINAKDLTRIKVKYNYEPKKKISLFYPPKWGINENIKL